MSMSTTTGGCGEADSSVKWQLCYDVTAKTWWMVSLTPSWPKTCRGSGILNVDCRMNYYFLGFSDYVLLIFRFLILKDLWQ